MGFDDIVKKIWENTEKKIGQIELSFTEENNKLISITNKKQEEIKQILIAETEKKIEAEKNRITATANIELNKEILQEKKKLIGKVFSIAYRKFLNLPEREYKQFLIKLIVKNIQSGNEEIFLPENYYKKHGENLLKEINTKLKNMTIDSNLKITPTATITSGCVIKFSLKEINATIEEIFTKYREDLEQEVSYFLFHVEKER